MHASQNVPNVHLIQLVILANNNTICIGNYVIYTSYNIISTIYNIISTKYLHHLRLL